MHAFVPSAPLIIGITVSLRCFIFFFFFFSLCFKILIFLNVFITLFNKSILYHSGYRSMRRHFLLVVINHCVRFVGFYISGSINVNFPKNSHFPSYDWYRIMCIAFSSIWCIVIPRYFLMTILHNLRSMP